MARHQMPVALLVALALLASCQSFRPPEASGPGSTTTPAPPSTAQATTVALPTSPPATVVTPSATAAPSATTAPPTATATATAVPSPTATQTPVPPTATPTPEPTGTISGRLGYPSEGIPPLDVYAVRVDDPQRFYLLKTTLNQTTFLWSGLAPGHYYIIAYPSDSAGATMSGAYSEFSACGLQVGCPSHSLIPVPVRSGRETSGVEVTDWYAPSGTFPPRPPGTPITTLLATGPTAAPPPIDDTPPALPNPDTADLTPEAVIGGLYDAINRHDFASAYALWSQNGAASGKTYAEFVTGYATTDHVTIHTKRGYIQGAAGSSYGCVPIVLLAVETDGTTRSFAGAYLLRRSTVVPGGDPNWRIERATMRVLDHVVLPGSEESSQLLDAATCP